MIVNKNIQQYLVIFIYEIVFIIATFSMLNSYLSLNITRHMVLFLKSLLLTILLFYIFTNTKIEVRSIKVCFPLVLFTIYELLITYINNQLIFPEAYYDIFNWPLLFIVFQDYFSKYKIPYYFKKHAKRIIYFLALFSLLLVYKNLFGNSNAGGVIFNVYYLLTYIPLILLLLNKTKDKNVVLLFTAIPLLLSQKRAGTFAFIIGYVLYKFSKNNIEFQTVKKKLIKNINFIIIIVIFSILFLLANSIFYFGIFERILMLKDDGGSGRNSIWIFIIESFYAAPKKNQYYGHGYQSVYYKLMPYGINRLAHNSYIEFLYDYGYIGLFIFLFFIIRLILKLLSSIRKKSPDLPYFIFSIIISFVLSMSSYYFEESAIIMPISILWGYCFKNEERNDIK